MKAVNHFGARRGVSPWEVLCVIGALSLAAVALLLAWARPRQQAARIFCANNLKQTSTGLRFWANDHDLGRFPMAVSTNQGGSAEFISPATLPHHFQLLSNYLPSPRVFLCPQDQARRTGVTVSTFEQLSLQNLSYFLSLDPDRQQPDRFLAGDGNLTFNGNDFSGLMSRPNPNTLTWTRGRHFQPTIRENGNVALVDGSVLLFNTRHLRDHLAASTNSERFLLP